MAVKTEDGIEFLTESVRQKGMACSTVSNGHVLAIAKSQLQALLEICEAKGTDKVVIFVERPDFKN